MSALTGTRFGRLVVVRKVPGKGRTRLECRCDCGKIHQADLNNLKRGSVQSCGCLRHDTRPNLTHGQKGTRLYRIWGGMKTRCFNQKVQEYPRYGGRGITICAEWRDFEPFMAWALANGYRDDLTIDRIDTNGHYAPSNCRWIPLRAQTRNRRSNRRITYRGTTRTLAGWAEAYGLSQRVLHYRLKRGWTIERALTTPVQTKGAPQ